MDMYYVALLPPAEINKEVLSWKEWIQKNHGCQVALRSPGHITMIPPFRIKPEIEKELIDALTLFASEQKSFNIELRDFSHFGSRTIYINVRKNEPLENFRNDLFNFFASRKHLNIPHKEEKFIPHITIATRDLNKLVFDQVWDKFRDLPYKAAWSCQSISLLRHNKKNWDVIATSQFNDCSNFFIY